jgi:taurine dioxygenase
MMKVKVISSGKALSADIEGIDLSKPLDAATMATVVEAWSEHLVLRFRGQKLSDPDLERFSAMLGPLDKAPTYSKGVRTDVGSDFVTVISNVVENGVAIGDLGNAEALWHTDMSYSRMIAFTNVLYALKVPVRDGVALGATEFSNMHAAYDGLPDELKRRLEGMTAIHDFNKFWEKMRQQPGSRRGPLTPEQRAARPPVSQPLFMVHPITGRKVLYCNPGYAIRIEQMDQADSDAMLEFLFAHQLQPHYRYAFSWTPRTVLMWDNMGTIHNAIADYRPDEHRLIKRCQVAATRFFAAA